MNNIEQIRKHFPALSDGPFFASAGIGPLPIDTIHAMQDYQHLLRAKFDETAWEDDPFVEARKLAAELVGASEEEISLTDSTTTGINLLAGNLDWQPGDNIVMNDLEYPSNILPWLHQVERHDLDVRIIHGQDGAVLSDDLIAAIDEHTRVLAISHVQFGTGYRSDIAKLADAVHSKGGLICVDAIQSLGVLDVDVDELGVDVLATGSYKWLCGPLGTGFCYIKRRLIQEFTPNVAAYCSLPNDKHEAIWNALISGSEYPMSKTPLASNSTRYERQGLSPVLFKGLSESLKLFFKIGMDKIQPRIEQLVDYFIEHLQGEGVEIITATAPGERAGIVTISVPYDLSQGKQVKLLEGKLKTAGIKALPRGGGLRFAIHFFNTREELDQAIDFVKGL